MGSMIEWQAGHDVPAWRCCSGFCRVVGWAPPGGSVGNVVLTSGGADGTAEQRSTSRMNLPRRVGEPESACDPRAKERCRPPRPYR